MIDKVSTLTESDIPYKTHNDQSNNLHPPNQQCSNCYYSTSWTETESRTVSDGLFKSHIEVRKHEVYRCRRYPTTLKFKATSSWNGFQFDMFECAALTPSIEWCGEWRKRDES